MIDLSNRNLVELPSDIPIITDENFDCHGNHLTSLVNSPRECKTYDCELNDLISLFGIPKFIKINLWCRFNPYLTDVSDLWNSTIGNEVNIELADNLAVLPLVKFKTYFFDKLKISNLLSKNKGDSKRNIIDLQYDLFDAGFGNHAKWKP